MSDINIRLGQPQVQVRPLEEGLRGRVIRVVQAELFLYYIIRH